MPEQRALEAENFLVSSALPRTSGTSQSEALAKKRASLPALSVFPEARCRNSPGLEELSELDRYSLRALTGQNVELGRFGMSIREGAWNYAWIFNKTPVLLEDSSTPVDLLARSE